MFLQDILLATYSNYRIGGNAKYFYQPNSQEGAVRAIQKAQKDRLSVFVLGGGTNILFNDKGYNGLVLKPAINFIKQDGNIIKTGSGVLISDLLNFTIKKGLSGLEWAGGLPGTVGGAIRGNAGAFRGEIKDNIIEVISLDFSGGLKIIKRNNKQCRFNYRDSVFKSGLNAGREIILEAVFKLIPGSKNLIRQSIEDKIKWRGNRQPLDYPNIGSIFKNIDWKLVPKKWQDKEELAKHVKADPFSVLPAATLIDKCGLKGVSCGGAMVSQKHPNFIVNSLSATETDVRSLIRLAKEAVQEKFNINLEEEIMFV